MEKMTDWFDKYTRPHWYGVYETRVHDGDLPLFNHWNGLFWERPNITKERTENTFGRAALVQSIEWRGFTKNQDKKEKK